MKVLAIILNIFIPGLGSLIGGRVGAGLMQLMLLFICIVLNFTVVGTIIGVPLAIVNWIWPDSVTSPRQACTLGVTPH